MHVSRSLICIAAVVSLTGCLGKKGDDGASSASASASAAPAPVASASGPAPDAKPTIEPRVKAELDNRADGITGAPLVAPGALAALMSPPGWQPVKGEVPMVASPDKKAQLAAASFAANETASAKLPTALTALGLTACEWGAPETVTIGKTKLASTAADGVCKRGATTVRTAWASPGAERLLVVGAWEPDGDAANVFGAMRSIAKIPQGDPTGIAACCSALRNNARSAPTPQQRDQLLMAANVCDSMRTNPQGRAALAQMRAQLKGANMPTGCR